MPSEMMYVAKAKSGEPWGRGELVPFGNISMSPAAGILNYGQGIFEGMKAQRTDAGAIVLFRTESNAARFASGAARMGMPPVPEELFVEATHALVAANAKFVPPAGRGSLYIRPCLMGSGAILGVQAAPEFTFIIYASPVGPYFKGGMSPISLQVADEFHRACIGGSGGVKAIGNYAPGIVPSKRAKESGFSEIIYLDAREHRYVEEVGAANFFCVKDGTVYTPFLSGSILPGITRMSVIQLAKDLGHQVKECKVDIELALSADEAFCTGTAAVISPIGKIQHGDKITEYAAGKVGPLTRQLYDALQGIQLGRAPDPHGWLKQLRVRPKL
jgi:branched-chain amino acid aminotransferase